MSEAMGGPGDQPRTSRPEDASGGPYDAPPAAGPYGAPPPAEPYAPVSPATESFTQPPAPPGSYGEPPAGYGAPGAAGYSGFGPPATGPGGDPPGSVRTVVILLYIAAGLAFLGGLFGIVAAAVSAVYLIVGLVLIAIGVAYIVLAGKLKQGNRTARTVAVVLSGLSLLANVVQLRRTALSGIIGIALNAAIIYLLMFHADSKRFFGDPA